MNGAEKLKRLEELHAALPGANAEQTRGGGCSGEPCASPQVLSSPQVLGSLAFICTKWCPQDSQVGLKLQ